MPPAPPDRNRPRRRRKPGYRPPRNFRTEQAAPQPRPTPRKGPVAPQSTGGGTSDRQPPIPSRPRPTAPKGFGEPFRRKHGLEREQDKAVKKSRRAEHKLPDNPAVPHFPVIARGYTRNQKATIRATLREAALSGGYKSVSELYADASPNQRRNLRQVGRIVQFGPYAHIDPTNNLRIRARNLRDTVAPGEAEPNLPKKALQAGLFFLGGPGQAPGQNVAEALGKTALNVGRATYESPLRVGGTSLRTAKESITGIPQGIKALADDPVQAVEMIVKDYEDRYGSVLDDPGKFRERVKAEWGLTPYVFDAAAAAGGGGQVLGAVAKTTRFARAAEAMAQAEMAVPGVRAAGRAGRAAHRAVTTERPGLRFSGAEEGGVQPQRRSRNLFAAVGQDVLDARRAKALEQRRARPGKGRALDEAVQAGEVTPVTSGVMGRSLRETPFLRRYTGRTARDIGGAQSTQRVRMLTHMGRTTNRMRKLLDGLSKAEKVAVREMAALGVRADEAGLVALRRRLEQIDPDSPDAAAIRQILADPEKHLTARAGEVVDELTEIQIREAQMDPRLPKATEELRRLGEQARLLGVERGPNVQRFRETLQKIAEKTGVDVGRYADQLAEAMPEDRPALAKKLVKQVRKDVKAAEADVATARVRLARAQGRVEELGSTTRTGRRGEGEFAGDADLEATWGTLEGPPDRMQVKVRETDDGRRVGVERYDSDGRLVGRLAFDVGEDGLPRNVDVVVHSAHQRKGIATQLYNAARAEGFDMRRSIQGVRSEAGAALRQAYGTETVARRQLELRARRETRDHVRKVEKALKQAHRKAKSQARKFDPKLLEDHPAFAARVRAAADEAGLAEPAYWKGIIEGELDEAPRMKAVGRGLRATERPKRTEYRLSERGEGERDPEVLIRGVETNIKRRFQYQLVVRNIETHAFDWSRGEGNTGLTIDQIGWYLRENGIDPESVEMLDTRILSRRDVDIAEDPIAEGLDQLSDARVDGKTLGRAIRSGDYRDMAQNRYLVFPREVGEAVDGAAVKLDSTFTRAMEVLLKQKPARLMLGALNVPWLGFQVASNALLTGLGGGLNPFDIYGAHKWWKGLDVEARDAIEAELGITHGHHFNMDQPNLGATNNRMVATWRGFKQTKAMRVGHRMNPLDAMFRADEAQNNFFRRTLFYSKAKRAAYRRMGSNVRGIGRNMDLLMDRVLSKDPERIGQAIAKHGPEFEQTAKHVRDWLGDYLRFSPSERFLLSRHIMFYGYLRFSLRFVFYTMPVGHPIMTAILTDIGRMGAQEIKDIFGVPEDYALPTSMLAQAYFGGREAAQSGTLRSINFGRMNPFLNAVTQMEDANQSLGLVSPIYQAVADQFFEESSFTGRDWRVRGEYTPSESERPRNYYGMEERGRIALRQLLKLGFPYRVAEDMLLKPSQTDDALAWSPRPLYPKEEEAKAGVAKSRQQWREEGALRRLGAGLVPVLPTITAAPAVIEREREKEKAMRRRASGKTKRRRRRSSSQFGGSSGSQFGG